MTQPFAQRQRGFTFVELTLAMAIIGLMTWAVTAAYANSHTLRDRDRATQTAETLRSALRAYALTNARLPCPDTDGDGWAGGAGGACGATDQTGWFPYSSLGLDLPDARFRASYAVYRRPAATLAQAADLVQRLERSGDAPGDAHYQGARDLVLALNNASADALSTARARLTGNNAAEGAVDCALNVRSHPAFFVVLPIDDLNADGNRFDGPHAAGVACAWAPGTAYTQLADDVVLAEPLSVLAGWLAARAP